MKAWNWRRGMGCVSRLVRLRVFWNWWGWPNLAWSALVYWPAGAFWGVVLVFGTPYLKTRLEQPLQESQLHQESQAISESEAVSPKSDNSTPDSQKAGDEDYLNDPPATSRNLYCPSCGSPLGLSLHSLSTGSNHEPFSEHALEVCPFLPND